MTRASTPLRDPDPLVHEVTSHIPLPLDVWEITAFLESRGFTDELVRKRYGFVDVFALADHVLAATRARPG